jgi:hypothetical protein
VAKSGPSTISFTFASAVLSLQVHQDRITEQETTYTKLLKPKKESISHALPSNLRKSIALWKFPGLRPFALLVTETSR